VRDIRLKIRRNLGETIPGLIHFLSKVVKARRMFAPNEQTFRRALGPTV